MTRLLQGILRCAAVGFVLAAALGVAGFAYAWEDRAADRQGLAPAPLPPEDGAEPDANDLDSLLDAADEDISQLARVSVAAPALQVEVSSVSRQTSTVGRSPAAVFVISNEMIRRSGARCIPEILRMAPGLHVSRIDANKWAVSIRGFNGQFADKLLVQIDGRSVYTPLFAGVFWDVQDVVLEDVERIEVVRGPGATVWGANAVNGIINIITKKASDTQGAFVQAGAGTEERGFTTARYGGQIGEDIHYRVYGKWFERDRGYAPGGTAEDDWGMGRGGFRADFTPNCCNTLTLQGDYYGGRAGNRNIVPDPTLPPDPTSPFARTVLEDTALQGGNVLFRWTRVLDDNSDWTCQAYYDRTERSRPITGFQELRDTFDLDLQRRFPLGQCHSVICGLGYRNTKSQIHGIPDALEFTPSERADDLFSYFIQDEIMLREDLLYLTVGSKFEHNDFTGFEFQPTARLLWTPTERHSIWGAISRAVRTPALQDHDMRIRFIPAPPLTIQMTGSDSVEAEDLLAYELGIRVQPTDRFSWDLAVFFHQYNDLIGLEPGAPTGLWPDPITGPLLEIPVYRTSQIDGQTYGFELAGNYQVNPNWKLYGAYSFFQITNDGPAGVTPITSNGDDARNHFYAQSSWDLGRNWEFDLTYRYVDSRTALGVPSYHAMDVRLAWRPNTNLELAVVGRHLLDGEHAEYGADPFTGNVSTEVQPEVYGTVTWRY